MKPNSTHAGPNGASLRPGGYNLGEILLRYRGRFGLIQIPAGTRLDEYGVYLFSKFKFGHQALRYRKVLF